MRTLTVRVSSGARRCDTHIYACGAYPLGLLGPVTILWQSGPDAGAKHSETKPANKKAKRQHATRAAMSGDPPERLDLIRTVWIRSHPAMFEQVQDAVQTAVAKILAEINRHADPPTSEQPAETIEIRDLKDEMNAFDLIGPQSTAILQGVLNLVKDHGINSREKIDVSQTGVMCWYSCLCTSLLRLGNEFVKYGPPALCLEA